MTKATLTERMARVEEQISGQRREFTDLKTSVDAAFVRGSNEFKELHKEVRVNEVSRLRQWIAVVLISGFGSQLPPWISKFF